MAIQIHSAGEIYYGGYHDILRQIVKVNKFKSN